MKINTQILLAFLLIALIPLVTISFLAYYNTKSALTNEVLSHLESVADIQESRVESIVEQNLERLSLVSSRTQLRLSLSSYLANPNTADQDKLNAILLDACGSVSDFENISVITLDGIVLAATDEYGIGAAYPHEAVFLEGQLGNNADTFFLDEDDGLSVYLNGPLHLEGELLGVIVIESTAERLVAAIADYTGLGNTGETVLAARNEHGDAVFLAPTRFEEGAALSLTVAREEGIPVILALAGEEMVLTDARDYRGESVLAATRYVNGTGWGLVAKMDRAEALAAVTELQAFLIAITILSLIFVMVVAIYLTRLITNPIQKLTLAATRVSQGDLSELVDVNSSNEVGVLTHSFNEMMVSLRKSEQRYRTTLDSMLEGCQIIDPEWRYVYVNDAAAEQGHLPKRKLLGRTMVEVYPGIEKTEMFTHLKRCMKERVSHRMENEFSYPDGSKGWFDLSLEPVAEGVFILSMDITERKGAEARIIHLNAVMRAIRNVNQLITRGSDREHLIQKSCDILVETRGYEKVWVALVDENKKTLLVTGTALGEEAPLFLKQMGSGNYPRCVQELFEQESPFLALDRPGLEHEGCVLAKRHSQRGVYRYRLEYEGKVYGVLGVTVPVELFSDEEERSLFLELCGDISYALAAIEKKEVHQQAEEKLRQSQASLAEAQRVAHIGSWELDLSSNELVWSDEVYRIFGLEPQQFGATYEAFLDSIHPDDREMVDEAYNNSVKTKTPYDIVHRLLLKDGTVKYVNERCETYYDDEGKPVRSLGTVQDVTELKQAELALRQWSRELENRVLQRTAELEQRGKELAEANVNLEEMSRHKSQFLANMSHELRTPLNSIIGYTKLMLDGLEGEINEEQHKDLQTVYNNSRSLLALINDLLDLSKIEAGKITVSYEAFTIDELIDDVIPSMKQLAEGKGLALKHSVAPGINHLYADRAKTRQTLINILGNAVKFTDQGGITLDITENNNEFVFSVSDTGMGINKEDLGAIFDSFAQAGPSHIAGFEGTGLGLAISKQFVEMQGGKIWVESQFGKGSTFIFTLPKKEPGP